MRFKAALFSVLLAGTTGCSGDISLQGSFEKHMKEDQVDGFNVIHIEERGNQGFVLYTAWTDEFPDNRYRPGINYYEKQDDRWVSAMGTDCGDAGLTRLGLMGNGHVFCSTLKADMAFVKILAGDSEARIFEMDNGLRVWFAVTDDRDAKIVGLTEDGRENPLN